MRILITGADGNVGSRLVRELTARGHVVTGTDIGDLDLTNYQAVIARISSLQPELVIHCAAMTNVDRCAEQPEEALRINAGCTQTIALGCQRVGAAMCYLSTNEVFDGERGTAYQEYDPPR